MAEKPAKFPTSALWRAAALCSIGLASMPAAPASAADIKSELPPDLVADHCLANGVGSETEGTFVLPGGQRLTGTVRCEPDDLLAAPPQHADDDDDDDDEEDDENDE